MAVVSVFAGWVLTLATVMLVTDAAPGAIVLFPRGEFTGNLPEDAAIMGKGAGWIAIKSDAPGLGAALYRAGGTLVLPAGLPGCLPLPAV